MTVRPVRPVILLVVVSTKDGGNSPSVDAQSVDEVYNSTTSWRSDGRRLWAKKMTANPKKMTANPKKMTANPMKIGESDEDYNFDIFFGSTDNL